MKRSLPPSKADQAEAEQCNAKEGTAKQSRGFGASRDRLFHPAGNYPTRVAGAGWHNLAHRLACLFFWVSTLARLLGLILVLCLS